MSDTPNLQQFVPYSHASTHYIVTLWPYIILHYNTNLINSHINVLIWNKNGLFTMTYFPIKK